MQRGTHNAICAFSDHVQDLVVVGHVERQGSDLGGFWFAHWVSRDITEAGAMS